MIARSTISAPGNRLWFGAAFLWGLAEATLFFIVPDVLLTALALRRGARRAFAAAGFAAIGALVGGVLMYSWAARNAAAAEAALDLMPAIAPAMIDGVRAAMAGAWPTELFIGAVSGIPYKIYAAEAGAAGIPLAAFLAVSAIARFVRFAGAILLTALGRRVLRALSKPHWATPVLAAFWLCFYAGYFWLMPN